MLVLSRRCNESIRFPELDIEIEVLGVRGSNVRLGVEAPIEITILRGELEGDGAKQITKKVLVSADDVHAVRNKLNSLSVATALAKKLLSKGKTNLAASTLDAAIASIADSTDVEQTPALDEPSESKGPKVLLVEDAPNEREMLAGFLRLHGYDVSTAMDGVEALDYLEENEKPDFILVDMNLPRLKGSEVIRRVRENVAFDEIDIFAVSGETPEGAGVDLDVNRVANWFQKPLEPAGLVAAINRQVFAASQSDLGAEALVASRN